MVVLFSKFSLLTYWLRFSWVNLSCVALIWEAALPLSCLCLWQIRLNKNSMSAVQVRTLKWSYWEYLCQHSWTLDVPGLSFIFPVVYDLCASADSGEEDNQQTPILCVELEEFDLCSYLVFLCLLIFYRLVPVKWSSWELAVAGAYRQDIYTLLKMNENLGHLQVLNVCGMQATDHSVAKDFGAESCYDLIYMWMFKLNSIVWYVLGRVAIQFLFFF